MCLAPFRALGQLCFTVLLVLLLSVRGETFPSFSSHRPRAEWLVDWVIEKGKTQREAKCFLLIYRDCWKVRESGDPSPAGDLE